MQETIFHDDIKKSQKLLFYAYKYFLTFSILENQWHNNNIWK